MLIIGLTGGIGSGKSTVAQYFAELGINIIDTDQIAREVVKPDTEALKKIVERFGDEILITEKTLNRKKLREIIFADPKQRQWLEQLLHPLIRQAMLKQVKRSKSRYCIIIIPLLLETRSKVYNILDRILVVDASEEEQIKRTQQRDQLSIEQITAILQTQVSRAERLAAADDIIHNNGDLQHLKQQVMQLHHRYSTLAKQK